MNALLLFLIGMVYFLFESFVHVSNIILSISKEIHLDLVKS